MIACEFMDWLETNNSKAADIKDMKSETDKFWGTMEGNYPDRKNGVPISVCLKLCAQTRTIPWLTIPHRASRDLVDHFAEQIRHHSPTDIPVMLEYSNENMELGVQTNRLCDFQRQATSPASQL